MKNSILYFLLCLPLLAFSQRKNLNGRVVTDGAGIGGIYIINKGTGAEKKSDALGNFVIEARAGDVITAYSSKTEVRDFVINEKSFEEDPYIISINTQTYELDEVVVEKRVTSESLSLVPPGQKRYTPAERKLFTATSGFGIDILLNALSGRTQMLKRALETEKKEMLLEMIGNVCTEEELRTEYKIPEEYTRGFVYYVVEDKEFVSALRSGNDTMARFLMTGLATKYRKIIADEK